MFALFSQLYIQNEIKDYYIKQAEAQHGGSISNYYENQARTWTGFYSGVQYQKTTVLVVFSLHFWLHSLKPVAKAVELQAHKAIPALAMDVLADKPPAKALSKCFRQGASNVLLELTDRKQATTKKKAHLFPII